MEEEKTCSSMCWMSSNQSQVEKLHEHNEHYRLYFRSYLTWSNP